MAVGGEQLGALFVDVTANTAPLNAGLSQARQQAEQTGQSLSRAFLLSSTSARRASTDITRATHLMRGGFQNLSFQIQDVIVQMEAGVPAARILAQQGSQIAGAFGPAGAAIGILVAGLGLLASSLVGTGRDAKSASDEFDNLTESLKNLAAQDARLEKLVEIVKDLGVQAQQIAAIKLQAEVEFSTTALDAAKREALRFVDDILVGIARSGNVAASVAVEGFQSVLRQLEALRTTAAQDIGTTSLERLTSMLAQVEARVRALGTDAIPDLAPKVDATVAEMRQAFLALLEQPESPVALERVDQALTDLTETLGVLRNRQAELSAVGGPIDPSQVAEVARLRERLSEAEIGSADLTGGLIDLRNTLSAIVSAGALDPELTAQAETALEKIRELTTQAEAAGSALNALKFQDFEAPPIRREIQSDLDALERENELLESGKFTLDQVAAILSAETALRRRNKDEAARLNKEELAAVAAATGRNEKLKEAARLRERPARGRTGQTDEERAMERVAQAIGRAKAEMAELGGLTDRQRALLEAVKTVGLELDIDLTPKVTREPLDLSDVHATAMRQELGTALTKAMGQPVTVNPDGTFTAEQLVTVQLGTEFVNVPSEVAAKPITPDIAAQIPDTQRFTAETEALAAAQEMAAVSASEFEAAVKRLADSGNFAAIQFRDLSETTEVISDEDLLRLANGNQALADQIRLLTELIQKRNEMKDAPLPPPPARTEGGVPGARELEDRDRIGELLARQGALEEFDASQMIKGIQAIDQVSISLGQTLAGIGQTAVFQGPQEAAEQFAHVLVDLLFQLIAIQAIMATLGIFGLGSGAGATGLGALPIFGPLFGARQGGPVQGGQPFVGAEAGVEIFKRGGGKLTHGDIATAFEESGHPVAARVIRQLAGDGAQSIGGKAKFIGERGPAIFRPEASGTVFSNEDLMEAIGSITGAVVSLGGGDQIGRAAAVIERHKARSGGPSERRKARSGAPAERREPGRPGTRETVTERFDKLVERAGTVATASATGRFAEVLEREGKRFDREKFVTSLREKIERRQTGGPVVTGTTYLVGEGGGGRSLGSVGRMAGMVERATTARNFFNIEHRQMGGPVSAGQAYFVGETSAQSSPFMVGGASTSIHNDIAGALEKYNFATTIDARGAQKGVGVEIARALDAFESRVIGRFAESQRRGLIQRGQGH